MVKPNYLYYGVRVLVRWHLYIETHNSGIYSSRDIASGYTYATNKSNRACLMRLFARIYECLVSYLWLDEEREVDHRDPILEKREQYDLLCNLLSVYFNYRLILQNIFWKAWKKPCWQGIYMIRPLIPPSECFCYQSQQLPGRAKKSTTMCIVVFHVVNGVATCFILCGNKFW